MLSCAALTLMLVGGSGDCRERDDARQHDTSASSTSPSTRMRPVHRARRKRPATLPPRRARDSLSTDAGERRSHGASRRGQWPVIAGAAERRSGDAVAGSDLGARCRCSFPFVSLGGWWRTRALRVDGVVRRFPSGARHSSTTLSARHAHRPPGGDRGVGPGLGAGGARPREAGHRPAGRRSCRA